MKCFVFYAFLTLIAQLASNQTVYFRHYQVESGLANNTVFSVYQDRRGFMWFGTKEGLNRFDGSVFKTFNINDQQNSDAWEFIYSIQEGVSNTLWLGTRNGLYQYDPMTELFDLLPGSEGNEVLFVQADHKGNIWFKANSGVCRYNEFERKIYGYGFKLSKQTWITTLSVDGSGRVLACSGGGQLFLYEGKTDKFQPLNARKITHLSGEVTKVYYTRTNKILIGSTNGFGVYDPGTGVYDNLLGFPAQSRRVYVRDILPVSEDEIWVASESGIHKVSLTRGAFATLQQDDLNPYSLSDNAVYALFKDRENGIWCGTYFGGLNYYHSQLSYFQKYYRRGDKGLSGNAVRELCPDREGNIWVGTEDAGLNKLNTRTGEVERYPGPNVHLAYNIHSLLIDSNELWIGTFQQGLDVMDLRTGKYIRHYNAEPDKNGLKSNFIISSCKSQSGQLFFGTAYGVFSYNRKLDRFDPCPYFPDNSYVFSLYEDSQGTLWAGTIGTGLYSFNPATGRKMNYRYDPANNQSIASNSVCGIFEDSKGNLWLSTEGGGLSKLDKASGRFKRFNAASGLPSNMVYKVLEDLSGNLWVSTSRGLAMYNPRRESWKTYSRADGLLTDQFNYSSGYRAPNGKLYLGSVKGLIGFDPEVLIHEQTEPDLYITSFQNNNREIELEISGRKHAVDFAESVILAYDQSSFAIGFAALSYISGGNTSYAYRLDGLEKSWTRLISNRKVHFSWLPPGDYKFQVRTVDSDGKLQSNLKSLVIRIRPPWWRTGYAYVSYLILAFVISYTLVNQYRRRRRERHRRRIMLFNQEKEKELYKAKIDFFTNVAHEIRTPLTLIKGPLELVVDEVGELPSVKNSLKNIERNTERLVLLTDQLLDFRKTENHGFSLSFVKVSIPALVRENIEVFVPSIEREKLVLKTELPDEDFIGFVDLEAFRKIMSNLMGNATKYAGTFIHLKLTSNQEPSCFTIEISNDGPKIPAHLRERIFEPFYRIENEGKQGSGIGLALARALTNLHGGTLVLRQNNEHLNVFTVTLPIHQSIEFQLESVGKLIKP